MALLGDDGIPGLEAVDLRHGRDAVTLSLEHDRAKQRAEMLELSGVREGLVY